MAQKDFRTYHRRETTRKSGYHACNETTGGECRILHAERYVAKGDTTTFIFSRPALDVVELFEKEISMIAFGGYVCSSEKSSDFAGNKL